jgi:16S rRNA (cytosine967-C5)-methyltransferase
LLAEPAYAKGLIEVQDEGSQLAALLAAAQPGMQVLDLCAGAGGKTLALAAGMDQKGQIYATDIDGRRLMPIYPRLERAGVRNVQVRAPRGQADILSDLSGKCDIVFVDAPCTGTGTWRRNPDAKWRTRPGALEQRVKEQAEILDKSCQYVKHGGALVYVTCSVLREENEDQITAFLQRNEDFTPLDAAHICRRAELPELARFASQHGAGLRFSPYSAGTDGFYVCVLMRTRMEGREFW